MKNTNFKKQSGFTLIETLMAILILTLSVGALLALAAGGFYSVRYSRNQIVANNLLQESIEFIRNTRDTSFEQGLLWDDWQTQVLSVDTAGNPSGGIENGCLSANGCFVDPYSKDAKIKECEGGSCPFIHYYPETSFYGYPTSNYAFNPGSDPYETTFVRSVYVVPGADPNQMIVTAVISWLNGQTQRSISQSTLITNWRQ
jgi:type II secretory pathway pseudopilin PulG